MNEWLVVVGWVLLLAILLVLVVIVGQLANDVRWILVQLRGMLHLYRADLKRRKRGRRRNKQQAYPRPPWYQQEQ